MKNFLALITVALFSLAAQATDKLDPARALAAFAQDEAVQGAIVNIEAGGFKKVREAQAALVNAGYGEEAADGTYLVSQQLVVGKGRYPVTRMVVALVNIGSETNVRLVDSTRAQMALESLAK